MPDAEIRKHEKTGKRSEQARNELGTPGAAKNFLRGAQSF